MMHATQATKTQRIITMRNPVKMAVLVIAILCSLSLLPLSACSDRDNLDTQNKSFIWKISSEVNSIYLLGSIHVANPEIYPLDSSIEDAFELADNLVVEVDITQIDEMQTLQLIMDYGTYPPSDGLRNHISDDLYAQLVEQLGFYTLLSNFDIYRPWVVVLMQEQLQLQELGYNAEYGIDLYFINKAVESGKDIIELETADFQFELLGSLPDELMILVLEENIENPLTPEDAALLFEAWEDGDAVEMESLLFEALNEEPALAPYYDKMVYERNINMAETIEGFLTDDESYFLVVGAGHLVGDNGLIAILDERGYVTEQLYDHD
jgi:uncharacterized protein YbaP (TraB family)